MKKGAILGLILTVVLVWPAGAAPKPVTVTIEQLLVSPDRYAMKDVRLTGQIDSCSLYSCHLCPTEMTGATLDVQKCISMSFAGFHAEDGGDPTFDAATITAERTEETFRYATVTLEAWFNPSCLTHKGYNDNGSVRVGGAMICTDRAAVLLDAQVIDLRSRKSVLDGLVTSYDYGPMSEPDAAVAAEFRAVATSYELGIKADAIKVLIPPRDLYADDKAIDRYAFTCICRLDDCAGKWPKRYVLGFDSPANPFRCAEVYRRDGVWIVVAP